MIPSGFCDALRRINPNVAARPGGGYAIAYKTWGTMVRNPMVRRYSISC